MQTDPRKGESERERERERERDWPRKGANRRYKRCRAVCAGQGGSLGPGANEREKKTAKKRRSRDRQTRRQIEAAGEDRAQGERKAAGRSVRAPAEVGPVLRRDQRIIKERERERGRERKEALARIQTAMCSVLCSSLSLPLHSGAQRTGAASAADVQQRRSASAGQSEREGRRTGERDSPQRNEATARGKR